TKGEGLRADRETVRSTRRPRFRAVQTAGDCSTTRTLRQPNRLGVESLRPIAAPAAPPRLPAQPTAPVRFPRTLAVAGRLHQSSFVAMRSTYWSMRLIT